MTQMLLEAKSKLALKPIERLAKQQGFSVRYVAPVRNAARTEKKCTNPLNPSPSGDPWWDDPRNVAIVDEGLRDLAAGRVTRIEDFTEFQELRAKYGKKRKANV